MQIEKTFHSFQEYTTGNRIMYELLDKKRIHGELSQQDQDHLDELQKRIAKYLLENGNDIGDGMLKEKGNDGKLTVQIFLDKHKDYYLTALDNTICLEVHCKKRNLHVTELEIADLKELGYINILSTSDYYMMCCGQATFIKN